MYLLPNNSQRAKHALIALYAVLGVLLVFMISSVFQLFLLKRIEVGNYTEQELESNDQRHVIIAYVYIAVIIICAVFFIYWFRRAYNNLSLSLRANTLYSDGWAAGCWFVPFINLYRPYEIMKEIWVKTQESIPNLLNIKSSAIIGFWWVCWLVSNILANISTRFYPKETITDYINSSYLQLVSDVIELVALVLVISIVKQVSKMETALQNSLINEEEKNTESEDKLDFIYT